MYRWAAQNDEGGDEYVDSEIDDDYGDGVSHSSNLDKAKESVVFESMFIEVKGPGDHLAYKQVLWLQVLNLLSDQSKTFVCQVRE
ncbi:hypothetical protein EON65_23740 [archaeon]|nr:MAG: hypothetical protein EON65_23740 [archaeon]